LSRIGKIPIPIPEGVTVTIRDNLVHCKGPLGELSFTVDEAIRVRQENGAVVVERQSDERRERALHGLTRSMIANMIEGVSKGFQKTLEIHGTGYRAFMQGNKLNLSLGFSHPVEIEAPEGIKFEVPSATTIVVKGVDKQLVGQTVARIRALRPPEPYLGKGIRYQGERVRRKEGKAGR